MNEDLELESAPESQQISSEGKTVEVEIYRLVGESTWVLEVVDEFNNSTVWDDRFESGAEAFSEVNRTISTEGIGSLIGGPSAT